jgi:hypothetical protein
MHCVWATNERRPLIKSDLQQRLWPYLGGIAPENKMKALVASFPVCGVDTNVCLSEFMGPCAHVQTFGNPFQR